jgi:hypothetical protein
MSESNGERLKEACDKSGILLTVAKAYNGFADGYARAEKQGIEQAATEYDRLTAERISELDESERAVCVHAGELEKENASVVKERNALRERLAKLEAVGKALLDVGYDPTERESVDAWHAMLAMLHDSAKDGT